MPNIENILPALASYFSSFITGIKTGSYHMKTPVNT